MVWEIHVTLENTVYTGLPSDARVRPAIQGSRTSAPWGISDRRPAEGLPPRDAREASVPANAGRAYAFLRSLQDQCILRNKIFSKGLF